jgi:hypothetical protein
MMPKPLSTDIKELIAKWYFEDQYTMAEIAEQHLVGTRSKGPKPSRVLTQARQE